MEAHHAYDAGEEEEGEAQHLNLNITRRTPPQSEKKLLQPIHFLYSTSAVSFLKSVSKLLTGAGLLPIIGWLQTGK